MREFSKKHKENLKKSATGRKHSDDTKMKMSKSRMGKKRSDALKEKMSKIAKNRHYSEKTRKRMSEAHTGMKASEETKKKMSNSRMGKPSPIKGQIRVPKEIQRMSKRLHNRKYRCSKNRHGKLSIETIQLVYEDNIKKYGTLTCYLCLNPIVIQKEHLEHKIPLSRGGTNDYENLGIACGKCNLSKNNKTVEEYQEHLRRISG